MPGAWVDSGVFFPDALAAGGAAGGRRPFALVGGVCYDLVTELRAEAGCAQI